MIELRRRARVLAETKKKMEIPALLLPPVIERIFRVGNSVGKTQDKCCPKCGKHCDRGLHIHMKYCKAG